MAVVIVDAAVLATVAAVLAAATAMAAAAETAITTVIATAMAAAAATSPGLAWRACDKYGVALCGGPADCGEMWMVLTSLFLMLVAAN